MSIDKNEKGPYGSSAGDYPYDTSVKLQHIQSGAIGWAHRDGNGDLLSAYSRAKLNPEEWEVVEELEDQQSS